MVRLFWKAALVAGLVLGSGSALAADWSPRGPIKMYIAFAAGGGADTHGRLIAEELENQLGWEFIPSNVTGQGGLNMLNSLKDEPYDGSAIGVAVTESLAYNMEAARNPGMSARDFTPIVTTAGFQMGVIAKPERGWKTFQDVVDYAKRGNEVKFGVMSPKLGDLAYLLGRENGVDFNIVNFRGGKAVMNAVNADDVDIGWAAGIQSKAVLAGDLVNLASGLSTKLEVSPDAPTMEELGVDYTADGYFLIVAPRGLPPRVRDALADAVAKVAQDPQSKAGQFLQRAFGGASVIRGAELDRLVEQDIRDSKGLLEASSQ